MTRKFQSTVVRVYVPYKPAFIAAALMSSLTAPAWTAEWDRARVDKVLAASSQESPADLINQNLTDLNLSGVDFSGANMRSITLNGSNLADADLSGVTLDLAIAPGVN
ncbi:MAG: pentapeptide repeat-containing protein, partial [Gammaproteobacteria bacterium]|nr:pentapeptide repeat-containing protein [Gammaproteobacteria bacterium]